MITPATAPRISPRARRAWHIARRTLEVVAFVSFLSTGVGLCWAVAATAGLFAAPVGPTFPPAAAVVFLAVALIGDAARDGAGAISRRLAVRRPLIRRQRTVEAVQTS